MHPASHSIGTRSAEVSLSEHEARFLIVDDHPLFRDALHSAIVAAYPKSCVTEASSMSEALAILDRQDSFDLALLDLKIPDTTGFDGLLEIRARFPHLPIVVVSGHEDPQIVRNVISYGAAGFIPKSIKKDRLTSAIQHIMLGELFLPDDYREPEDVQPAERSERDEIIALLSTLTRQQRRVIKMLRDGLLNKQIAHELQVGETTVKAHVSEILRKLNVNNRTQAAMKISQLGSLDFDALNGNFDAAG